jgi:preprotein translocase subunit SecD
MRVLSLTAITGFFPITPCIAEPLALEISSASAGFDQRTGKPILKLSLAGESKLTMYYLSINNIGEKLELLIDGKRVLTSFFREPLRAGVVQISDPDLTAERIQELVTQLSRPNARIEIDRPSD